MFERASPKVNEKNWPLFSEMAWISDSKGDKSESDYVVMVEWDDVWVHGSWIDSIFFGLLFKDWVGLCFQSLPELFWT